MYEIKTYTGLTRNGSFSERSHPFSFERVVSWAKYYLYWLHVHICLKPINSFTIIALNKCPVLIFRRYKSAFQCYYNDTYAACGSPAADIYTEFNKISEYEYLAAEINCEIGKGILQ